MANIDLKNLIDTIVGMARESLDLRKRNAEASWYGGNKDEEEYWKEMRRRNTELELRGAEGRNRLAEREMINSGDLEKQRVADAGALARQGLTNEATRYTADQNLQAHQYTADTNYAMKRDELNKGYDPELIKAHAAIIANVNSSPEAVAASNAAIDFYTKNAVRKSLLSTAPAEAAAEVPAPTPAAPAAVPAAVPAAPAEVKVGPLDFDKPDEVPGTKSAGRQSMEFRAPGSIDPAAAAAAKKKSEERLLYGTKPQRRGWF